MYWTIKTSGFINLHLTHAVAEHVARLTGRVVSTTKIVPRLHPRAWFHCHNVSFLSLSLSVYSFPRLEGTPPRELTPRLLLTLWFFHRALLASPRGSDKTLAQHIWQNLLFGLRPSTWQHSGGSRLRAGLVTLKQRMPRLPTVPVTVLQVKCPGYVWPRSLCSVQVL